MDSVQVTSGIDTNESEFLTPPKSRKLTSFSISNILEQSNSSQISSGESVSGPKSPSCAGFSDGPFASKQKIANISSRLEVTNSITGNQTNSVSSIQVEKIPVTNCQDAANKNNNKKHLLRSNQSDVIHARKLRGML